VITYLYVQGLDDAPCAPSGMLQPRPCDHVFSVCAP